jgi:hypothetical protein
MTVQTNKLAIKATASTIYPACMTATGVISVSYLFPEAVYDSMGNLNVELPEYHLDILTENEAHYDATRRTEQEATSVSAVVTMRTGYQIKLTARK